MVLVKNGEKKLFSIWSKIGQKNVFNDIQERKKKDLFRLKKQVKNVKKLGFSQTG